MDASYTLADTVDSQLTCPKCISLPKHGQNCLQECTQRGITVLCCDLQTQDTSRTGMQMAMTPCIALVYTACTN